LSDKVWIKPKPLVKLQLQETNTMESDWITRWASRLHEWLEPEEIRQHIAKLGTHGGQYQKQIDALEATLHEIEQRPPYLGHSAIRESQLPLVSPEGYFLRGWNFWNVWHNKTAVTPSAESVLERLFSDGDSQTLVIIDHVDYCGTPRLPRFLKTRRSLEICQIFIDETLAWTAKLNANNLVGLLGKQPGEYLEYWDSANGAEGTIRSDFILNRDQVEKLVRCQFSGTEFPESFCYLSFAYVFFQELADESEIPLGHVEPKRN
jgi:hypothetical protein